MSSRIFPALSGQDIEIERTVLWPESHVVTALSGKETSIAYQSSPRYQWEFRWNFLRAGTRYGVARTEMQELLGFFNQAQGPYDDFLFTDVNDSSVTDQSLGLGDGSTTTFQLVRALGGFVEPVLAPNVVSEIKIGGVIVASGGYAVSSWGAAAPGVVTFDTAPGNGLAVTGTFTYYWPARFVEQDMNLRRFLYDIYDATGVKIISKK